MLFSEALKKEYENSWPFWVSGTSSPWITSYSIKKLKHSTDIFTYQITYQWATSAGPFHPPLVQTIKVVQVPKNTTSTQKWWIISIKEQ